MGTLIHYKNLQIIGSNNELEIEQSYFKNGIWFVLFKNIHDRNTAETLIGSVVGVYRNQFPDTAIDEYYWVDLSGLNVINLQNECLGVIDSMMDTGANSVMVVKDETQTRLIPFVAVYVSNVDIPKKLIIVDWGIDY